jgi:hypothetical protein
MKVKTITPCEAAWIEFQGDDTTYLRFGADNWMFRAGESIEAEYNCTEHEAAYQAASKLSAKPATPPKPSPPTGRSLTGWPRHWR